MSDENYIHWPRPRYDKQTVEERLANAKDLPEDPMWEMYKCELVAWLHEPRKRREAHNQAVHCTFIGTEAGERFKE